MKSRSGGLINYELSPQKGFTLIELLVVISIIGLLASVVLASLQNARTRAQNTAKVQEVEQIVNALELYHLDHGYYPGFGWVDDPSEFENMYCVGYKQNEICMGAYGTSHFSPFIGNDDLNIALSEYIPGPPRNDFPVVASNGKDYKGIAYGCVNGPDDCVEYELWWYLKDADVCPRGDPRPESGNKLRCVLNSTNKF